MEDCKVIVCTGGIGSGKSYVIKAFNAVGIPSYDSDGRAKKLYDCNEKLLSQVVGIAGDDILNNGRLDRKRLAEKIFSDQSLLERVEGVVHPAVLEDFELWKRRQESRIVIFESAIFLQKPQLRHIADYIVAITAPEEVRINRVMVRDSISREQVLERMSNQMPSEEIVKSADYTIYTNDRDAVLPQIYKILKIVENS
ncbi:MAG: dephospho-CoA kinase [Bacteroidales bacterium]|nr:dephospho-CoA kinase [Bacteroidales bacterium]